MDHRSLGRLFLSLLGVAFVAFTAVCIHGSSVAIWSLILHESETLDGLLWSAPKPIRSDEWLVWTPSALAQARHQPPFPVENPALGAGRSPMLMSLPTRHFTTLFRPQLWGYFLFDFEHGYAWHWNAKAFGLLAAMFVLIRRLAGGDFWLGVLGSAWIFCSSFTQWWFSCPPMLPEMLASWAVAIMGVIGIVEARGRWQAVGAVVALAVAAVNFALCLYPPFQVPLAWLGLAILGGWFWQRGGCAPLRPALGWIGLALVIIAAVLTPFFIELLPTLHMVSNTSYPGARRTFGGALSFSDLFLGLAEPLFAEKAFPEKRVNVCNAATFSPIWMAATAWLLAAWRTRGSAVRTRLLSPILGCVLVLAVFAVCPLPPLFATCTLLSLSTEDRCLLPIGVGGILLSVLALREMRGVALPLRLRLLVFAIAAAISLGALLGAAAESPRFFTMWRGMVAGGLCLGLFALYLWPFKRVFAGALLAVLVFPALNVNPVMQGLAPLTKSTAIAAIQELRRADPTARWLAYDGANHSALLMAAGVAVWSGAKTVPNLPFYARLDPERRSLEIYNRYSLGIFGLPARIDEVRFEQVNFLGHSVFIHPTHPALRAEGIRYFVFLRKLPDAPAGGLHLLRALPERGIWIYRLAEP